jgi:hypothetical protein
MIKIHENIACPDNTFRTNRIKYLIGQKKQSYARKDNDKQDPYDTSAYPCQIMD